MAVTSAGIVIFRKKKDMYEIFLTHPGGPFWVNKDQDAWSIPKGEISGNEDPFIAAKRELLEETGLEVSGEFFELEPLKLTAGKILMSWAIEYDSEIPEIKSNTFELEWPPKSGIFRQFPEADMGRWFTFRDALGKLHKGQKPLIASLAKKLGIDL